MNDRYPIQRRPSDLPDRRRSGFRANGDASYGPTGARSTLEQYREILARRARTAIWVFVLVVAAVMLGTFLQEPVYRATALLEIRNPSTGLAPTEALAAPERISPTVLGTERGLLESPALARRVVSELELHRLERFHAPDSDEEGEGERSGNPGSTSGSDAVQEAVDWFLERLTVHPKPDSRLVEVSFDFENPEMAARIVNSTLANYTAMRLESARRAVSWLDGQMDSLRTELGQSEERLREYAQENELPLMVEDDLRPGIRSRIQSLEEDLAEAEANRYEAEALHSLVVQGGDFEAAADRVVESLAVRLSELRREYAEVSSTFTDDYPHARQLRRQIEEIEGLMDQERDRIVRSIDSRYQVAQRQEQALRSALERERAADDALARESGRYHLLRNEVMAHRDLYASLQERRGEAHVSSALEAAGIGIVDEALPPGAPHRPIFAYNLALALLAGLALGVGGAFLREYLDDTVRAGPEAAVSRDVPVLALVPSVRSPVGKGRHALGEQWPRIDRMVGGNDNRQMLVEAFGMLRTAVLFRQNGRSPRSLLISSCQPEEGKTTVGLNLALSLHRLDRKVLLVDGDLRRSGLSMALGLPSKPGLADHLRKGGSWRSLVRKDGPGPDVLCSGGPIPDVAELLSHPRMERFVREAEEEYDLVIVDAPALFMNVPDASILAETLSGVVVVARSERTPNSLLGEVLESTPNVMGVVVNDLNLDRLPERYRRFFTPYPYGPEPKGPRWKLRKEAVPEMVEWSAGVLPDWHPFEPQEGSLPLEALPGPGLTPEVVGLVPTPRTRQGEWSARAAAGLAREWSHAGRRVALLDLAVDAPVLHRVLGESNEKGWVDVLERSASLGAVTRKIDEGPFHLIARGPEGATPAEALLSHERWEEVLESLAGAGVTVLLYLPSDVPGAEEFLDRASRIVLLAEQEEVSLLPDGPWLSGRVRAVLGPPAESGTPGGAKGLASVPAESQGGEGSGPGYAPGEG